MVPFWTLEAADFEFQGACPATAAVQPLAFSPGAVVTGGAFTGRIGLRPAAHGTTRGPGVEAAAGQSMQEWAGIRYLKCQSADCGSEAWG